MQPTGEKKRHIPLKDDAAPIKKDSSTQDILVEDVNLIWDHSLQYFPLSQTQHTFEYRKRAKAMIPLNTLYGFARLLHDSVQAKRHLYVS
eukprot:scaffold114797_cov51-Attheya_sp.AAC.12